MKLNNKLNLIVLATTLALTQAAPAFSVDEPMKTKAPMSGQMEKMMMKARTGTFTGVEVKKGSAELYMKGDHAYLRVSSDFEIPMSPAPHWQVVDKAGNVYLLNQFRIVGDKTNREIMLPAYIKSISKVQVWCSFAEVVLGEASFSKAMDLK